MKPIGILDPKCEHVWKVYMVRPAEEEGQKLRWSKCSKCGSTRKTITRPDKDLNFAKNQGD
jgi:hypothetical protein